MAVLIGLVIVIGFAFWAADRQARIRRRRAREAEEFHRSQNQTRR